MSMICCLREADEGRIDSLLSDPDGILDYLEQEVDEIDLDKAWHGIHYLLTGSVWGGDAPLCYLVEGGEQIGDVDVGYGPARALRPGQLKDFAAALAAVPPEELRRRFDPASLRAAEIYPDIWDEGEEALDYLLEYYEMLRSFVAQSSARGSGALVYIA